MIVPRDYINRPNLIMRTQNRSGTDDVLKHYSESLTAINNTTWIQNLLTQSDQVFTPDNLKFIQFDK